MRAIIAIPSRIWIRHHANRDGKLVKLEARLALRGRPL